MNNKFVSLVLLLCPLFINGAEKSDSAEKEKSLVRHYSGGVVSYTGAQMPEEFLHRVKRPYDLESAQRGEGQHLYDLVMNNAQKCAESYHEKHNPLPVKKQKILIGWYTRLIIRLQQDVACCSDKSTEGGYDTIYMNFMGSVGDLFTLSDEERKVIQYEQLEKIREKTEADTLGSPKWVAQFGMNVYFQAFGQKSVTAYPAGSVLKAKRLAKLDELKALLDEESNPEE